MKCARQVGRRRRPPRANRPSCGAHRTITIKAARYALQKQARAEQALACRHKQQRGCRPKQPQRPAAQPEAECGQQQARRQIYPPRRRERRSAVGRMWWRGKGPSGQSHSVKKPSQAPVGTSMKLCCHVVRTEAPISRNHPCSGRSAGRGTCRAKQTHRINSRAICSEGAWLRRLRSRLEALLRWRGGPNSRGQETPNGPRPHHR